MNFPIFIPARVFIRTTLFLPLGNLRIKSIVIFGKLNPWVGEIIITRELPILCKFFLSHSAMSYSSQLMHLAAANSENQNAIRLAFPVPEKKNIVIFRMLFTGIKLIQHLDFRVV